MNFNDSYLRLYQHLKLLPPGSPEFMRKLLAFSSALEKLFPKEFHQKMQDLKVVDLMKDLNSAGGEMVKQIDQFHLNPQTKTIEVILNKETLSAPIVDINKFIENNLNLKPNQADYWLVLSYLTRMENFELFQITHGLILS